MKIAQVGGYPPPYGGNTVHVQRLHSLCRREGVICSVIDWYGERKTAITVPDGIIPLRGHRIIKFFRLLDEIRKAHPDVVHFHLSEMRSFIHGGLFTLTLMHRFPKVATIHSGLFPRDYFGRYGVLGRATLKRILLSFDAIIAVNSEIGDVLRCEVGFPTSRILTIPAFLPPLSDSNLEDDAHHKLSLLKRQVDSLLFVSGYMYRTYGFHIVLEAMSELALRGVRLGAGFVFYADTDPLYEAELTARIRNEANVLVFRDLKPNQFLGLLSICDIFIRPTETDGDSVALREAAYLGKQIIASDSVSRPNGCALFRNQSASDLARVLLNVLEDKELGRTIERGDNWRQILALYTSLANRS